MSRLKGGLLTFLVLIGFILVIYAFRRDNRNNPELDNTPKQGLAETWVPPDEQKSNPLPTSVQNQIKASVSNSAPEKLPAASVEDSLLTSPSDREAWRECVAGEAPSETDNLQDWARSQSSEPPTVHYNNTHFKDASGNEFRIRYLIDDGPDDLPVPRLQMFSVDREGHPLDIVRTENMDFTKAEREIDSWMANGQKFYEERSSTYYFEDGEATVETENGTTRALTVTKGPAVLICSLKGTAVGSRCTCKGTDRSDTQSGTNDEN